MELGTRPAAAHPGWLPLAHGGRDDDPLNHGRRSPLTSTLHPDDSIIVPVLVEAPSTSGSYVLEVDLVHEGVRWFGSPLCIDVVVKQGR